MLNTFSDEEGDNGSERRRGIMGSESHDGRGEARRVLVGERGEG